MQAFFLDCFGSFYNLRIHDGFCPCYYEYVDGMLLINSGLGFSWINTQKIFLSKRRFVNGLLTSSGFIKQINLWKHEILIIYIVKYEIHNFLHKFSYIPRALNVSFNQCYIDCRQDINELWMSLMFSLYRCNLKCISICVIYSKIICICTCVGE